jgi:hypothetical protein
MRIVSRLVAATAVAAIAATGVAGAANAPSVSKQQFIVGTAPLTIPGTGVKKGDWMGSKARLVYRDVTLTKGQQVRLTLRASGDRRIRGLAEPEGQKVGFAVVKTHYPGSKRVTVRMFAAPKAHGEVSGRIYALTR